jgi:hypothetical protein
METYLKYQNNQKHEVLYIINANIETSKIIKSMIKKLCALHPKLKQELNNVLKNNKNALQI